MKRTHFTGAMLAAFALAGSYVHFQGALPWSQTPTVQSAVPDVQANSNVEPRAAKKTTEAEAEKMVELQSEVNTLKMELAALKAAVSNMRSLASDDAPAAAGQSEDEEFAPTSTQISEWHQAVEEQRKNASAEYAQRMERLESRFAAESLDRDWAFEKSQAVKSALDSFSDETRNAAASARSLECRSSMCRVEMEFDSEEARNGFDMHLAQSLAPQLPSMDIKQEMVGNVIKVTYFLKGVAG